MTGIMGYQKPKESSTHEERHEEKKPNFDMRRKQTCA
jgi:hypothetical protein